MTGSCLVEGRREDKQESLAAGHDIYLEQAAAGPVPPVELFVWTCVPARPIQFPCYGKSRPL